MGRIIPRGCEFWPDDVGVQSEDAIVALYKNGYAGAYKDPDARERYKEDVVAKGGILDSSAIASTHRFAGSSAGKLVIPFTAVTKTYPGVWPGPGQVRGSCVADCTANTLLLTMCCDIVGGKPDQKTGKVEEAPQISPEGIKNRGISFEAIYWYRGYNGDGWECSEAASVALKKSGIWLRQNYPELGVDLTKYSGQVAGLYGSKRPPENINAEGIKHLANLSTELEDVEAIGDFLLNGFGVSSCGSEGFEDERDENGVSARSGSWAHAMAIIGVDLRTEVQVLYGGPLVLVLNSWGKWNSGPRKILGTNIEIPEGAFWAKWSQVKNRYYVAFSGVNGWEAKQIDWLKVFSSWS